jgi:hypothetical protein
MCEYFKKPRRRSQPKAEEPFTWEEAQRMKDESILIPMLLVDVKNEIVEILCLDSMHGMSKNNGTPVKLSFSVYFKRNGKVKRSRLVYALQSGQVG